jgi:hypothetical protein
VKKARLRKTNITFSLICGISIKKTNKHEVEQGLFGERGIREGNVEYNQTTLYIYMACHNNTHYFVQLYTNFKNEWKIGNCRYHKRKKEKMRKLFLFSF